MEADQPTPIQCLMGARLCLANARRLYVASRRLRRLGFAQQAILLLATSVEELAKAGLLHRAWMLREEPQLFGMALAGFKRMSAGPGAHRRKHAAAAMSGSTTFAWTLLVALVIDVLDRERAGAATATVIGALLGSPPKTPPGWFDRLWERRQAVYVDWEDGRWVHGDRAAAAYYDEGRLNVLLLFHNLRADLAHVL